MKLYDLEHHFWDEATIEAMANRKGKGYHAGKNPHRNRTWG